MNITSAGGYFKMAGMERRRSKKASKRRKNTVSSKESPLEPENCIICFEEVSCRGKLGVCDHWFCFECIYEWSKNTNTCPVCKKRFRCISKIHLSSGKSPLQKVRVPDVDQRVWDDDDDDSMSVIEQQLLSSGDSSVSFEITDAQVEYHFYSEYLRRNGHDNSFIVSDSESEFSESDTTYTSDTTSEDHISISSSESSSSHDWTLGVSPDNNTQVHKLRVTVNGKYDDSDDDSDDDMDNEQPHVRTMQPRASNSTGFHRRTKTQKASSQQFQEAAKRAEAATLSRKKEKQKKAPAQVSSSTRRNTTQSATTSSTSTVGQWLNVERDRHEHLPSRRRSEKQKPRMARNEKPSAQLRSSPRTRGSSRNANDATTTSSTQRDHPSQTRRRKTRAVACDSDSEISDQQPTASKTRSSRRKALAQSPEYTNERKRRRFVLRERQNNELD